MWRRLLAASVALLVLAAPAAAAGKGRYRAEIRRTTGGVAHIKAADYGSLGFGYGYAYAQDQICELADIVTTVDAKRSRYLGETPENLASDFFYQRIKDERTVERLVRRKPPHGPLRIVRRTVAGFAAGVNAYLRKTGVAHISDPTCRGKAWVRPITTLDLWRRYYQLGLRASSGNFISQLVAAQPPGAGASAASAARLPGPDALRARLAGDPLLGGFDRLGSNGLAIGSRGMRSRRSALLGNPHFPWLGSERFYEVHLTVPGKLDATGAALQMVPVVNIGFNRHVAWTHTVSTARRFTPYELRLVPGRPTVYELDGKQVPMRTRTVKVDLGGGRTASHTFYETKWGPVLSYPAALMGWTNENAYALADVNADEFRLVNQWAEYDRARSVRDLRRANATVQGNPWTNTIAADDAGRAYYADESVTPNVDADLQKRCSTSPKAGVLLSVGGVILLDGSSSACKWKNDRDAVAKGIIGPRHQPRLERRDYVENSNNSYWLANPAHPLEGFARIIGEERTQPLPRARLALRMVRERLAGTDGLGPKGFTLRTLQRLFFSNRVGTAETARDAVVAGCRASGRAVLAEACEVLARWDRRADLGSRGAVLWRELWSRIGGSPWTTPFDPARPLDTPANLDGGSPKVLDALAAAVADLRGKGIALDVALGDLQGTQRGSRRIPIPGCSEVEGCFNIITTRRDEQGRYDPTTGSSFVMTVTFAGRGRPTGRALLSYSQSENPRSPHYADQTEFFSRERWLPMRFSEKQIRRDPDYSRKVVSARR